MQNQNNETKKISAELMKFLTFEDIDDWTNLDEFENLDARYETEAGYDTQQEVSPEVESAATDADFDGMKNQQERAIIRN